ncbi:MAG: hypothetical protein ACOCVQ_01865, partial [Bacillota bacterium]
MANGIKTTEIIRHLYPQPTPDFTLFLPHKMDPTVLPRWTSILTRPPIRLETSPRFRTVGAISPGIPEA